MNFGARGLVLLPSSTWDMGGGVVTINAGSFTMQTGSNFDGPNGDLTINTTGDATRPQVPGDFSVPRHRKMLRIMATGRH